MSNATDTATTSFADKVKDRFKGVNLRQNGIFLALIGLMVFFAITTPNSASITPSNISNLVVQNGYVLVLAIGMVMVIIGPHRPVRGFSRRIYWRGRGNPGGETA